MSLHDRVRFFEERIKAQLAAGMPWYEIADSIDMDVDTLRHICYKYGWHRLRDDSMNRLRRGQLQHRRHGSAWQRRQPEEKRRIGEAVLHARQEEGLTWKELEAHYGVSHRTLRRWAAGESLRHPGAQKRPKQCEEQSTKECTYE